LGSKPFIISRMSELMPRFLMKSRSISSLPVKSSATT